jgi:hypothetical protein
MQPFLFRCPVTGFKVQALAPDWGKDDEDAVIQIRCTACTRTHLVNPKTGEPFGK